MDEAAQMQPFVGALRDPTACGRAIKAGGGKVIGFVGNTVPCEIFEASGIFAMELRGCPGLSTALADTYMEALFDPAIRSIFQQILEGRYNFLDALVLPRTDDSAQRLYYYLCELRRLGDHTEIPEPILFDLLHTPWYSSAKYNFARLSELWQRCIALGGGDPGEAALTEAIERAEARRERIRALVTLRRTGALSPIAYLQILAASRVMAADAFDAALIQVIGGKDRARAVGARIVLAGNAIDDFSFYRLVQECGGLIVGDYNAHGEQIIGPPMPRRSSPLMSLTEHYHRNIVSLRSFPSDPGGIVQFVQTASAEGVVFLFYPEEEALTWEYPAQAKRLQSAGIPTLCLGDQPYATDVTDVRQPLEAFIASLESGR